MTTDKLLWLGRPDGRLANRFLHKSSSNICFPDVNKTRSYLILPGNDIELLTRVYTLHWLPLHWSTLFDSYIPSQTVLLHCLCYTYMCLLTLSIPIYTNIISQSVSLVEHTYLRNYWSDFIKTRTKGYTLYIIEQRLIKVTCQWKAFKKQGVIIPFENFSCVCCVNG